MTASCHALPRRILVTGASGFLGRHIVRGLGGDGHRVGAIVREGSRFSMPDAVNFEHDGSTQALARIVRDFAPDVVIHAATLFVAAHTPEDVEPLIRSNLLFGTQLLDAMVQAGSRKLLNFGTSWQYGGPSQSVPATLYAATKQAFDAIVDYYADARDLAALTLTLGDTYGPDDPRRKLVHLLLEAAANGVELGMSPGGQRVTLVHSDDVVGAVRVVLSMLDGMVPGNASYAVQGRDVLTLRELATRIERAIGRPIPIRWGARPYREREVMEPWIGRSLPGWTPQVSLDAGVAALFRQGWDHAA